VCFVLLHRVKCEREEGEEARYNCTGVRVEFALQVLPKLDILCMNNQGNFNFRSYRVTLYFRLHATAIDVKVVLIATWLVFHLLCLQQLPARQPKSPIATITADSISAHFLSPVAVQCGEPFHATTN
jgi:hypothetical protein